jgi:hypothetical protein
MMLQLSLITDLQHIPPHQTQHQDMLNFLVEFLQYLLSWCGGVIAGPGRRD